MTKTPQPMLAEARRRWGTVEVLAAQPQRRTFGIAARFTVNAQQRVPRVVEQRRDVSSFRLDKETP